MDISFIVPCFNEEGNVELFFEETEKVFSNTGYTYEYVFVNDGSSDSTKQKLKGLFEKTTNSLSQEFSLDEFGHCE